MSAITWRPFKRTIWLCHEMRPIRSGETNRRSALLLSPEHSAGINKAIMHKHTLLISSFLILPFTFGTFQILTGLFGPKWGYMGGFLLYWGYALCTSWWLSGGKWAYLGRMTSQSLRPRYTNGITAAAFLPVLGVFFVSFLPNAAKLTPTTSILLVTMALLNGTIEEVYWRGLYLLEYPQDRRIGVWASTVLFGAWHISLWFARGVAYQGGFMALVGGAFVMGLLWTGVTRSVGNVRACILAHVLVNLFAFTGLFIENGF